MSILFTPPVGVAADFIPFFWQGSYHLFYLQAWQDDKKYGEGTPWHHLVTRDFVDFESWGEALECGEIGAQDAWIFTGSVIEDSGTFHIFYTGHNRHLGKIGKPVELVMHAVSTDLRTWRKDPNFKFGSVEPYEKNDWRDPFVYRQEGSDQFAMLLTARLGHGPRHKRGCTLKATSKDLVQWSTPHVFYEPWNHTTLECPDLFRMGDWYYLIFSDAFVTEYRMSRTPDGPWVIPPRRTFAGRNYYAAKSAGDGESRFLFGWVGTHVDNTDYGMVLWGGHLLVHELVARPDGTLDAVLPDSVASAVTPIAGLNPEPILGQWEFSDRRYVCDSPYSRAILNLGDLQPECLIDGYFLIAADTADFGFILRAEEEDSSIGYLVKFEVHNQRVTVERQCCASLNGFFMEQPVRIPIDETLSFRLLIAGDCACLYVDGTAICFKMHERPQVSPWAIFVNAGKLEMTLRAGLRDK